MTITIKGRAYDLPSWWAGAGIDAKAAWVCAKGLSYPKACALLAKCRRKKADPAAALEKRGLW